MLCFSSLVEVFRFTIPILWFPNSKKREKTKNQSQKGQNSRLPDGRRLYYAESDQMTIGKTHPTLDTYMYSFLSAKNIYPKTYDIIFLWLTKTKINKYLNG